MHHLTNLKDNADIGNNVLSGSAPEMRDSKVIFRGTGNVLHCEPGVKLQSSSIEFNGNNGLVFLSASKRNYNISLAVNNNCTIAFGHDNYFNGLFHAIASEERSIIVGDEGLFSFGIWLRTADPHLVYDVDSQKRINTSKDIVIGDHVWIGQSALILKGSVIGSGSIVGAMGVVSGKTIPSNTSWAGNPVRQIRRGIFWDGDCVHSWTGEQTERSMVYTRNPAVYDTNEATIAPELLTGKLQALKDAKSRKDWLEEFCYGNKSTSRLAI